MAIQQVEQLGLERGAGASGIEVCEERVVGFFQHDRGIETGSDAPGKGGLADTDRSFDGDVLKGH